MKETMTRRSLFKLGVGLSSLGVLGGLSLGARTAHAASQTHLRLNICCDGQTFAFQDPHGSQVPGNGATFVVKGIIYPDGYFARPDRGEGAGFIPGTTPGTFVPQDPNLVIGTWYCRGWFINQGMATPTGPFVATTQIYDLEISSPGKTTLISDGIELVDLKLPWKRAITGGTGKNAGARGEVTQTALAANATGLFNFAFDFSLNPSSP